MNSGFYTYTVEFYDESLRKSVKNKGVVYASSYQEAAYSIEEYYDSIISMSLMELEEGNVYEIEDNIENVPF